MFLLYNVLTTMAVGCVVCKVLCSLVVHNLKFVCFMYVCVCVCVCVYIYIYIYIYFIMVFVLWVGI